MQLKIRAISIQHNIQTCLKKVVVIASKYFSFSLELIHLSQKSGYVQTTSFNVMENDISKVEEQEVPALVLSQKH